MIRFVLATMVSVCFINFAHSQESGAPAGAPPVGETTPEIAPNTPCAKDIQTYCANVQPGGGNIAKCMRDNQDKLSTECKMAREKMKKGFKELKEACHDDFEKFCSHEQRGGRRIFKCMKEHKDQLSEACKAEIDAKKEAHKKNKRGG